MTLECDSLKLIIDREVSLRTRAEQLLELKSTECSQIRTEIEKMVRQVAESEEDVVRRMREKDEEIEFVRQQAKKHVAFMVK